MKIVVGGGIIGCSAAHELAQAGCAPTLKEFLPDRFLRRASWVP